MKPVPVALCAALALSGGQAGAATFSELFPDEAVALPADLLAGVEALDFRQGSVPLGDGFAVVEAGQAFYVLDREDARFVLEELWGNPPDATLAMIFPAGLSPIAADSWGIEITYDEIGHVLDADAASYDYGALLQQMQADTRASNDWMRENGYPTQELIGWAAPPRYDAEGHQLYWAKEIRFANADENTLNYNLRVLGRAGVLNLNFIAAMRQLPAVEAALPQVLGMVRFAPGLRYDDFVPGTDRLASAGLGELIAGGSLAQAGLVAAALVLLKKFWFVLLIPLLWLKNLLAGRRRS
jgi:uncharacterized membrane-anchored protein